MNSMYSKKDVISISCVIKMKFTIFTITQQYSWSR